MRVTNYCDIVDILDLVYQYHDYDFRHYAKSSITRRIHKFMDSEKVDTLEHMKDRVVNDSRFINSFLPYLSVSVTAMFRDPIFFHDVRTQVIPYLKTFPFFKIWHAGCSTGEEAYSLAILLKEEGIYERARIYATDINTFLVNKARSGVFLESDIEKYQEDYIASGGQKNLNDYFYTKYGISKIKDELKSKIVFSSHNLVSDGLFGVMQLILCRNVIIYFDDVLKRRVINLFSNGLDNGGILCLGSRESLEYLNCDKQLKHFLPSVRVYRKQVCTDVH